MPAKFLICDLLRPVIRRVPFGRVRLLHYIGAANQDDADWQKNPHRLRVFFDHNLKAYVWVDLGDWGGRWHYYSGQYYDHKNPALIARFLRPGDTYVDIGANYGMHSIAASRVVGSTGTVISIEPNPATFDILRAHMRINGITNVRLFNCGLSDEPGELVLHGSDHAGSFTFRDSQEGSSTVTIKVPVHRADDLLKNISLTGRILVKIDVEGFEHRVLRGMKSFHSHPDLGYSVEVTDAWLRQTGSSAGQLFQEMLDFGFSAYEMTTASLQRRNLQLKPMTELRSDQHDVLFAKPGFLTER